MRFLQHKCTHCGTVDRIESALVFVCPTCAASPGNACVDQRGLSYRALSRAHQSRRDLLEDARADVRRQLSAAS